MSVRRRLRPFLPTLARTAQLGVYRIFGFDEFVYDSTMHADDRIGHDAWIADRAAFDELMLTLQTHERPLLVNLVTMQNHVPYDGRYATLAAMRDGGQCGTRAVERLAVCCRSPLIGHSPLYTRGSNATALPRQLSNVRVDLLHLQPSASKGRGRVRSIRARHFLSGPAADQRHSRTHHVHSNRDVDGNERTGSSLRALGARRRCHHV